MQKGRGGQEEATAEKYFLIQVTELNPQGWSWPHCFQTFPALQAEAGSMPGEMEHWWRGKQPLASETASPELSWTPSPSCRSLLHRCPVCSHVFHGAVLSTVLTALHMGGSPFRAAWSSLGGNEGTKKLVPTKTGGAAKGSCWRVPAVHGSEAQRGRRVPGAGLGVRQARACSSGTQKHLAEIGIPHFFSSFE